MDQKQLTIGTRLWSRLRWRVEMLYLAGHSALRPTPVPMHMVRYTHPEAQRPCCLIVFLPGRWNRAPASSPSPSSRWTAVHRT